MYNNECLPRIDIRDLLICRICGSVHGAVEATYGALPRNLIQPCRCVTKVADRDLWKGFDFPCLVEMCRCCGRAALPSGSRWSVWFCTACSPLITAINQASRYCVLPLTRHSLTSGVATNAAGEPPEFVVALGDWFQRVELREQFIGEAVLDNLKCRPPRDDVPDVSLLQYLRATPRTEAIVRKAVRALARRFEVPDKIVRRALSQSESTYSSLRGPRTK